MNDQRDIKDLLRGSIQKEEQKSRRRIITSTTLNSDLVTRSKKPNKSKRAKKDMNDAAQADATLLEELRKRYRTIGYDTNNQGVVRAGLRMLSGMSGAELRRVMQKVEEEAEKKLAENSE